LIFAVNMLVNSDEGDTFSFDEIRGWLQDTGFERVRTIEAPWARAITHTGYKAQSLKASRNV
jgi:hypothetical protein